MKVDRFRCTVCGRFVPWDADCGVPMGTCLDLEPRDPEWFCKRCAGKWKRKAIEGATYLATTWYQPPNWAAEALTVIGNVKA